MALGIGQGVRIGYTTTANSPYTWNRIKEITEFAPPEISYDEVDITSHDSGGWKRSIPSPAARFRWTLICDRRSEVCPT